MEKYDVKFKKKLGQNFLKDNSIVERIVEVSAIKPNSLVIEVGPGGGILTKELVNSAKNVLAYEIDTTLKDELSKRVGNINNLEVLYKDFLETDINLDIAKYKYDYIYFISNVPYYITTPIIMKLLDSKIKFEKIVLMVQKEVGDRFSAKVGTKEYGSITILLNYYYNIKKEFMVSKKMFVPSPKVDSVVISFTSKDNIEVNKEKFFKIVRDSFQFKRKNIKNNLKNYDLAKVEKILSKYNYDLSVRAEMLPVEVYIELSKVL
jgi:16S rRNA (adenine1518-N6/adenine1519-N6)-dimethyltransferase